MKRIVFAIVLGITSVANADSKVDWSDYIDKSPPKKPAAKTATPTKATPTKATPTKAAPTKTASKATARPATKGTPKTSVAAKQAPKRAPARRK